MVTRQTQTIEPMLVYCGVSVADGGPTLNQHWGNIHVTHCSLSGVLAVVVKAA